MVVYGMENIGMLDISGDLGIKVSAPTLESIFETAAISLFDKEFIKTGIFDKSMSKTLHRVFELRQKGDCMVPYLMRMCRNCFQRLRILLIQQSVIFQWRITFDIRQ
ncbi:MAG: hypothetical protein HQK99_13475 [Nitrospirae bacterium]|nr:hypothetical protein [Nitrospirota bacterium]